MKILFKVTLCVMSLMFGLSAFAVKPVYMGYTLGPGINYFEGSKNYIKIRNPAHASFAWGLYTGVNLNDWFSVEFGYLNLGFYENSGDGESICNQLGQCGFPREDLEHYLTKLTVVNDISAEFYYFDVVTWWIHTEHWRVFTKLGVALNDSTLTSYVDVVPKIGPIQFEVRQVVHADSQANISPHLALGYEYRASDHLYMRTSFNYFMPLNMVDKTNGEKQGTLFPMALVFGIRYQF